MRCLCKNQIIQNSKCSPVNGLFVLAVYVNRVIRQRGKRGRKRKLRSGWVDDSPWLCIADESCLAPQLLWQPWRAARQKKRGGAFKGEIEEKGLDGKDRLREGYRQTIKKHTERH